MYPNLSYFFHDLFGTEKDNFLSIINTFGFFLALAFLASAYVLYLEFKRKEREGLLKAQVVEKVVGRGPSIMDLLGNIVFGFILGWKLVYVFQNFEAVKENISGAFFSGDGNLGAGVLAALIFGGLRYWELKRKQLPKPEVQKIKILPHQMVPDITVTAAISGIIGAKLFALFEGPSTFSSFLQDPIGQLFSGSGLAIYGGLIVAFIVTFYYVKKRGLSTIQVMDSVAPALIMGYAVGRLGCQFSGDGDWGIVNTLAKPDWFVFPDWMWAYDYPRNVLEQGIPIEGCEGIYCNRLREPVFPTPLYEAIASFVIFAILWILRKRVKIAGMLFFIYCIFNGLERYWVEKIRVNEKIDFLGMHATQAEIIAVMVFVVGVVGVLWLWLKKPFGINT